VCHTGLSSVAAQELSHELLLLISLQGWLPVTILKEQEPSTGRFQALHPKRMLCLTEGRAVCWGCCWRRSAARPLGSDVMHADSAWECGARTVQTAMVRG
jgi:hypothetical protein